MEKVDVIMDALRQELVWWKAKLAELKAEGREDLIAEVEGWVKRGETILKQWDKA